MNFFKMANVGVTYIGEQLEVEAEEESTERNTEFIGASRLTTEKN